MSDSELKVECGTHGKRTATFVCKHIMEGEGKGFHAGYDPENPNDLFPDAWCDACDAILEQEDEWNDISGQFADIKLLCSACYLIRREKNWPQNEDALSDLINESYHYLKDKQVTFLAEYKIDDHERWDWYQETGLLIFSHKGKPQVEAHISFSGSFSSNSNTWMWAWANESLKDKIKTASAIVRELGENEGFLKLACALWPADEVDGWEMTALMAKQCGAIGVYRTEKENGLNYMIVESARWVNN